MCMDDVLIPFDGTLHSTAVIFHLREMLARPMGKARLAIVVPSGASDAVRGRAEQAVVRTRKLLDGHADEVVPTILNGDARTRIPEFATEQGCSLIAMTTHWNQGLTRLAEGSVTRDILRRSTVPMLVVHPEEGEPDRRTWQPPRVVLPLDGSDTSLRALAPAEALLSWMPAGSELVLVHSGAPASRPTAVTAGEAFLETVAAGCETRGVHVRLLVDRQSDTTPAQVIHDAAEEERAQVIAMWTHGGGGLRELLVGSVAEAVIARTRRPILLIRTVED